MTDLSLNLTATEFYNILVQQSSFNVQNIYEPGYAIIIMTPNSGPSIKLPIEVKLKENIKLINNPPLNLIIIGEDFKKVSEESRKLQKRLDQECLSNSKKDADGNLIETFDWKNNSDINIQLCVGSEYRMFRKTFGSSLTDFKFNLPCCYQVKSVYKFKLFIGTAKMASNIEMYDKLNISATINLSMNDKISEIIPSSVKSLNVNVKDEKSSNISKHLEQTTRFIKSNFENNKSLDYSTNIFVFCQMGISRSSTVILAYLIKEHDMSLLDAFNSLRESRDIIKPNFGFLKQLQDWEKVHTGHRTNLDDLDII